MAEGLVRCGVGGFVLVVLESPGVVSVASCDRGISVYCLLIVKLGGELMYVGR